MGIKHLKANSSIEEILEVIEQDAGVIIDNLLDNVTTDLINKKTTALNSLDAIVQSLCVEIESTLSL